MPSFPTERQCSLGRVGGWAGNRNLATGVDSALETAHAQTGLPSLLFAHKVMVRRHRLMSFHHKSMYTRPMDYSEFRKLLARTGLTLSAFAELLKMNRRSITNYAANGTVPDHLAMIAALIGNMADNGLDYRQVLEKVDIKKKKPRGSKRLALAERTNLMDSR